MDSTNYRNVLPGLSAWVYLTGKVSVTEILGGEWGGGGDAQQLPKQKILNKNELFMKKKN